MTRTSNAPALLSGEVRAVELEVHHVSAETECRRSTRDHARIRIVTRMAGHRRRTRGRLWRWARRRRIGRKPLRCGSLRRQPWRWWKGWRDTFRRRSRDPWNARPSRTWIQTLNLQSGSSCRPFPSPASPPCRILRRPSTGLYLRSVLAMAAHATRMALDLDLRTLFLGSDAEPRLSNNRPTLWRRTVARNSLFSEGGQQRAICSPAAAFAALI